MRSVKTDRLTGLAATALFTLHARAVESRRSDALFHDPLAEQWLQALEWDSSRYDRDWITHVGVAIRTAIIDEATGAFLGAHPAGLVVNVGSGLCTRFFRLHAEAADWLEIDLPEVIDLKRVLAAERPRYRYLARTILDDGWMDEIDVRTDRPVLFVAEGVLPYLGAGSVRHLIGELSRRFAGAEMLLDATSPLGVKLSGYQPSLARTGVRATWGLRRSSDLESWGRVRVLDTWYYDRQPGRLRWLRAARLVPFFRRMLSIIHLRFEPGGDTIAADGERSLSPGV